MYLYICKKEEGGQGGENVFIINVRTVSSIFFVLFFNNVLL